MTTPPSYIILPIPQTSPRLTALVDKFKTTKLAALAAEPTGFVVKHAQEVLHPLSVWESRLAAPSTILICVATPHGFVAGGANPEEDVLLAGEWVGMATVRGPLSWASYHLPASGQPVPRQPHRETYWHLCILYTAPAHRGKGLAKRIVHAALDVARQRTECLGEDKMQARVRLFFDPAKEHLERFYTGLGFSRAGMVTLREGFVANGDAEMLPRDTAGSEELRARWETRFGVAMEKIVPV
jgi:GNAT superfamily N-acetyltransferase